MSALVWFPTLSRYVKLGYLQISMVYVMSPKTMVNGTVDFYFKFYTHTQKQVCFPHPHILFAILCRALRQVNHSELWEELATDLSNNFYSQLFVGFMQS